MPKGRILSLFILRISFNLCLTFYTTFFYKIDRSRLPKQKLNSIMKKKKEWCNWHFYCPKNANIQWGEILSEDAFNSSFFETGTMSVPTKLRNPTIGGWGDPFQSFLTHS